MLKGKFTVSKSAVSNNNDEVQDKLNKYNVKESTFSKALKNNDWMDVFKKEDVKKLVLALSEVDGVLDVEIEDVDLEYENFSAIKKLFLIDLSEVWTSKITMASAYNTMKEVDNLEEKYAKCVLNFTNEEMRKTVIDLFSEMQYHKLRSQLNIISRFQEFYAKYVQNESKWRQVRNQKDMKEIIGEDKEKTTLTKKDLLNLFRNMDNPQDAVIPLLIFNGVSLSKVDDKDEIRYLRKEDLNGDALTIYGNGNGGVKERKIYLEHYVTKAVREAINQDFMIKQAKYEEKIIPLQDTEYILRPSENARKKKEAVADEDILSFRGAYGRVLTCKEQIEGSLYDIPFTPRQIETYGKIHYINKYINEGRDVYEAVRMTLVRFGEWDDNENGTHDPANQQRVNRLKKVWEIHTVK